VDDKFSHTYPERKWPKHANYPPGRGAYRHGIRFAYGDLQDVVNLLIEEPYTRQAYLPIFFPEDTGGSVRLKQRIPCSFGYHFMVRDNWDKKPVMDVMYTMRSCDFVRHFNDDMYMAARLLQWVAWQVSLVRADKFDTMPGKLRVHIASLHAMEGDRYKIKKDYEEWGKFFAARYPDREVPEYG
jgi:thymidylate synthase